MTAVGYVYGGGRDAGCTCCTLQIVLRSQDGSWIRIELARDDKQRRVSSVVRAYGLDDWEGFCWGVEVSGDWDDSTYATTVVRVAV